MPLRLVPALLTLFLLVAACGADASAPTPTGEDGISTPVATDDGSTAFPVSIEHRYGTTEVPSQPTRVLSLGYNDHDAILALGVQPIAVRYWFGDEEDVIYPWAEDAAAGSEPEILNMPFGELDYERIVALQPDLIVGMYSGITEDEYSRLSQIAPTITQTDEYVDFGMPWQETTITIGRALGQEDRARELVEEVESQFAEAREAHPDWEGQSVAVASYGAAEIGFFASEDPRSRFFTSLGFEVPAELDEVAAGQFFGTLSPERADLLDRDLLVWDQMAYVEGGRATIEGDPIVSGLAAMEEGRIIYMEGDVENAFAFNSVLSLPFVLDAVVPQLEEALAESGS